MSDGTSYQLVVNECNTKDTILLIFSVDTDTDEYRVMTYAGSQDCDWIHSLDSSSGGCGFTRFMT